MTAATTVGMWHGGVERGAEVLDNACMTRAPNASTRLVDLYCRCVCDFVLFCLVDVAPFCFLPAIYHR